MGAGVLAQQPLIRRGGVPQVVHKDTRRIPPSRRTHKVRVREDGNANLSRRGRRALRDFPRLSDAPADPTQVAASADWPSALRLRRLVSTPSARRVDAWRVKHNGRNDRDLSFRHLLPRMTLPANTSSGPLCALRVLRRRPMVGAARVAIGFRRAARAPPQPQDSICSARAPPAERASTPLSGPDPSAGCGRRACHPSASATIKSCATMINRRAALCCT